MREAHGRAECAADAADDDRQRTHEDNAFYPVGRVRFAQRQYARIAEIAEHQQATQHTIDYTHMLLDESVQLRAYMATVMVSLREQ